MFHLGLIGYPLEHSLSPRIHQAALRSVSLSGDYQLYPIKNDKALNNNLAELFDRMRSGEIDGLNVTVPYKQLVIPFLDSLDPAAAVIGAVNTIACKQGRLVGANTDAPGFLADLQRLFGQKSLEKKQARQALVLGAGGSAKAVVFALCSSGWSVRLSARKNTQAQELTRHFQFQLPGCEIETVAFDATGISKGSVGATLVVNTTPVGMWPQIDASPWPEKAPLPREAFVYDLVYNPARTALLQFAQQAGLAVSNGIGMLVEQAALAFEIWTGRRAIRQAMFAALPEYI